VARIPMASLLLT